MLIRAPAILFGIVVVFLAGVRLSHALLDDFENMKSGNIGLSQEIVQRNEILSYVGGGVAVALLITSLVFASQQLRDIILIALTILGFLFGLFTFLNPQKGTTPLRNNNHKNQNWYSYSEPKIIITCSNCSQKLRIPMKNKKMIVTCPSCHHEFEYP
jgi:hypothetical protein